MKIVFLSKSKDLRKALYDSFLIKNIYKDLYVFLINFKDVEKLKRIKEKYKINFIVPKKKISKIDVLKVIKEKINDDILFIEEPINFSIKKLKEIPSEKDIVFFGYKSKLLKILNLDLLDRIIYFKKEESFNNIINSLKYIKKSDIELEYFFKKEMILDILNNIKRIFRKIASLTKLILDKKVILDIINEKIGFIFLKLFVFLLVIILSRYFLTEIYGRYINFHSLCTALSMFITLSIPLYKFFSEKKNERVEYIINSLFLYLINSIIIFFILLLFKDFFLKILETRNLLIIPISIITSLLISIRGIISNLFISDLKYEINKYFDILEGLFKFIFILIFSIFYKTKGVIFGVFFSFFILDIVELLFLKKFYPEIFKKFQIKISKEKIKEFFKFGIAVNYNTMFLSFYNSFRYNLLSYLRGIAELTLYFNANIIVLIASNVFSIYNVFLPRIVVWSNEKIKENLRFLVLLQFLIYLILFIIFFTFSDKIILILFGEKFKDSIIYLKHFGLLLLITPLSIFSNILWIKSYLKEISIVNLVNLITIVFFDLLLIPLFGIFGAIYSLILSNLLTYLVSFIFFKRKI